MFQRFFVFILFLFLSVKGFSQNKALVTGKILDDKNKPLPQVVVAVVGLPGGTTSDENGNYTLAVPADTTFEIAFSRFTHQTQKQTLHLEAGEKKQLNISLKSKSQNLPTAQVEAQQRDNITFQQVPIKDFEKMPSPNMNFEAIMKTFAGVVSNNELSSEYSVRGGSFDENLVYVNDVDIYRPMLAQTGQQEGLSFINPDMVDKVYFSAGGFDAKYGDKMSSVLDVKYRKPQAFAGSVNVSLLGGTITLEGASKNKRLTYITGARYKSSQYILSSLETKGDYKPSAADFQLYVTDSIGHKTEIGFLGNYNFNKYQVIPSSRQTDFGTINAAYQLNVYFEGQEIDRYNTGTGALTITHSLNEHVKLKLIGSAYKSVETQAFDVLGQYYIGELENDLGSDAFGNAQYSSSVGSDLVHGRNNLEINVWNIEHKGSFINDRNKLLWGVKYQHEKINDDIWEWQYIDSAGFSLQNPFDSVIELNNIVISENYLNSNRYSGYVQNTSEFGKDDKSKLLLNYGLRVTYWDVNRETDFSPRISMVFLPKGHKHLSFKAAIGLYYQPPFYREMLNWKGELNTNLESQQATHYILGSEWQFLMWGRRFKFISEVYYKNLKNLVPYKLDNVRIQYYGTNSSDGYATGIDLRLNGELVEGAESWINFSYLKTEENIKDDYYYDYYNSKQELIVPGYTFDNKPVDSIRYEPGYIPRPTDQRITVSMFFQDYVPKLPNCKMHLALIFGTGLPFGPPAEQRYQDVFRYPPYRRVDIGFAYEFINEDSKKDSRIKFFNKLKFLSLSLEVYNLLQVNNTASYTWVTDVSGRQYAVPDYLTARQLNLKLSVSF